MSKYETEIVELHEFFMAWFAGKLPIDGGLPADDQAFSRLADVLGEGFRLVTPGAAVFERQELVDGLYSLHGQRKDIRIWIENVQLCQKMDDYAIVTYEEWQEDTGEVTTRLSTVIFREKKELPNGLEWLHVHETWSRPTEQRTGEGA